MLEALKTNMPIKNNRNCTIKEKIIIKDESKIKGQKWLNKLYQGHSDVVNTLTINWRKN